MGNRATLLRALRGPLLLILVGVLFLFDYSGGISVTKTWPFLIIAAGVLRLIERAFSPELPAPPPYTSGGAR